jgi:hypothetical protein
MVLLERAFQSVLQRHSDPLLDTIVSSLEAIYQQYYTSLTSSSVSVPLTRYIISLFGVLHIVLRSPSFNSGQKNFHRKALDQHILMQTIKFAQLPDETVNLWIHDPISIVDSSIEAVTRKAVRTAVLGFANEVLALLVGLTNSI